MLAWLRVLPLVGLVAVGCGTKFEEASTDGGSAADASADANPDSGACGPQGPGGNATQISCGAATCNIATTACCAIPAGVGCFTCGSTCPSRVPTLRCTRRSNCGSGQVCCIQRSGDGAVGSQCVLAGTCGNDGNTHRAELCDPSSATVCAPERCLSNNIEAWGLPGTFGTCGGVSP